jgi:hypothetical protein
MRMILGERRWSCFESQILVDHWSPYIHVPILRGRIRLGLSNGWNWRWSDLGPSLRCSRPLWSQCCWRTSVGGGRCWAHLGRRFVSSFPDAGQKEFIIVAGYSWKTNQYGLTVDTVTAFELVQPNGSVATVTKNSNTKLFFALKVRLFSCQNSGFAETPSI